VGLAAALVLCTNDSDALRPTSAERGAWAAVKPMSNRCNVPAFSSFPYPNFVGRCFKLKHFQAVATHSDKAPENYLASIKPASAGIWMRVNESMAYSLSLIESKRQISL
jgi:hypothetical protein